jgi:glutamate carboxypeptidase
LCVSHLDTVFPPEEEARNQFRWQREGQRIYGPGTVDIKGGTALLWLMLRTLQDVEPDLFETLGWQLFLNSSEEMLSDDFGVLCRQRATPGTLACLVFEGEGQEHGRSRLVVARKGRATWRVTATGRGAHAGNRLAEGANAILQLSSTLQKVAALNDPARGLTFNPGTVRGGSVLNRVPHEAVAEGELRAFDPAVFAEAKSRLLALAGPGEVCSARDGYRCQVAVEILAESRPWPRNPATDGLFQIWQQAGEGIGVPVDPEERGGLSDGNHVWDCLPTLDGLGPYGGNDHCSERSADGSKLPEFVDVRSFVPKARVNLQAIKRLAAT